MMIGSGVAGVVVINGIGGTHVQDTTDHAAPVDLADAAHPSSVIDGTDTDCRTVEADAVIANTAIGIGIAGVVPLTGMVGTQGQNTTDHPTSVDLAAATDASSVVDVNDADDNAVVEHIATSNRVAGVADGGTDGEMTVARSGGSGKASIPRTTDFANFADVVDTSDLHASTEVTDVSNKLQATGASNALDATECHDMTDMRCTDVEVDADPDTAHGHRRECDEFAR